MQKILKLVLLMPLALGTQHVMAQLTGGSSNMDMTTIIDRNSGAAFAEKYSNVTGEPYYYKDWVKGSVTVPNRAPLNDQTLKYDEVENRLLIKTDGDKVNTFNLSVPEFTLIDAKDKSVHKFRSGFGPTKISTERTYFEVLADGKTQLIRKNIKTITENKEYSGAVVRSVTEDPRFFLVGENNLPDPIKLDQKSVLAALPKNGELLQKYIQSNSLNLKKAADVAKLVEYYNTL